MFIKLSADHAFYRILELTADDAAIDDLLYQLSLALYSERITLDAFLKHVRSLGREQFMRRALLRRCRDVAGLGNH